MLIAFQKGESEQHIEDSLYVHDQNVPVEVLIFEASVIDSILHNDCLIIKVFFLVGQNDNDRHWVGDDPQQKGRQSKAKDLVPMRIRPALQSHLSGQVLLLFYLHTVDHSQSVQCDGRVEHHHKDCVKRCKQVQQLCFLPSEEKHNQIED